MSVDEYEIQCLKSVSPKKDRFVHIENDVSIIHIENIVEKLPQPDMVQEGRMLVMQFSGCINTNEKH